MHCSQQKGQLRPCAEHPFKFLYQYKLITATEKILDLNNSNVTKWGRQKRNLNVIWRLTVQNLIVTGQSVRQQRVQTLMKTLFLHIYTQTHTHCFSGSVQTETSSLLTHKLPRLCVYPAVVSHWWQCRVNYLRVQCWVAAWWLFKFTDLIRFSIQVRILVQDKIVCRGGERVCNHNCKKQNKGTQKQEMHKTEHLHLVT